MKADQLLKELRIIKISLQLFTILFIIYLMSTIFLVSINGFLLMDSLNIASYIHMGYLFVMITYIWTRYPIDRKKKWDNTWKIIFLGIIGLWLWYPNSKERKKLLFNMN